jgi:hypothetical protein
MAAGEKWFLSGALQLQWLDVQDVHRMKCCVPPNVRAVLHTARLPHASAVPRLAVLGSFSLALSVVAETGTMLGLVDDASLKQVLSSGELSVIQDPSTSLVGGAGSGTGFNNRNVVFVFQLPSLGTVTAGSECTAQAKANTTARLRHACCMSAVMHQGGGKGKNIR